MLISRKMEINYSKRDSSMMEFAAIDERREVASVNGADRRATVRPDERKLDGYDWSLTGRHSRRNRIYRARQLLFSEKPSATVFDENPLHQ